jgi:hypothetical protein
MGNEEQNNVLRDVFFVFTLGAIYSTGSGLKALLMINSFVRYLRANAFTSIQRNMIDGKGSTEAIYRIYTGFIRYYSK